MMQKSIITALTGVFLVLLLFPSCKNSGLDDRGLTAKENKTFKGCIEPRELTQESALESLRVLVRGDSETIDFYREYEAASYLGRDSIYQMDVCSSVDILSREQNREAYGLILKIIEKKDKYPRARICAIKAIKLYGELKGDKWHGDRRSVPVLKKLMNNERTDVRVYAAGALLSAGEADTALPVLEDIAKQGGEWSITALYMLFSPERQALEGTIKIVLSDTRLFDERGRDILVDALDYPGRDVRVFAASKLAGMGIERKRVEQTAVDVLIGMKNRKRSDYESIEEWMRDRNAVVRSIELLERLKGSDGLHALKLFIDKNNDKALQKRAEQAVEDIEKSSRYLTP